MTHKLLIAVGTSVILITGGCETTTPTRSYRPQSSSARSTTPARSAPTQRTVQQPKIANPIVVGSHRSHVLSTLGRPNTTMEPPAIKSGYYALCYTESGASGGSPFSSLNSRAAIVIFRASDDSVLSWEIHGGYFAHCFRE